MEKEVSKDEEKSLLIRCQEMFLTIVNDSSGKFTTKEKTLAGNWLNKYYDYLRKQENHGKH
jgi:hypothetical protein